MLTAPHPGNKYFFQLGKILLKEEPEIARRLTSQYLPERVPLETNLSKIPKFFIQFCALQQIKPRDYTGALYKSSKIDKRRLFVAVIIVLYHPRTRLVEKYISETIAQDPGNTSRMISEVEFRYKKMEDFRAQVDIIVGQLIKKR